MGAKNSQLRNGPRHNIVCKELYNRFILSTKDNISYNQFVSIINYSNNKIKDIIISNIQGFKLPEQLGYIGVTMYKPKPGKHKIDWQKTKLAGTKVYYTNFHSYEWIPRTSWYTDSLSSCRNLNVYKYIPDRAFTRQLAKGVLEGKMYNELKLDYFKVKKIRLSKNIVDGI